MTPQEQEMRTRLEEEGVEASKIDEFFALVAKIEEGGGPKDGPIPGTDAYLVTLQQEALMESDWRKKAALNAAIISHKLANGMYGT